MLRYNNNLVRLRLKHDALSCLKKFVAMVTVKNISGDEN